MTPARSGAHQSPGFGGSPCWRRHHRGGCSGRRSALAACLSGESPVAHRRQAGHHQQRAATISLGLIIILIVISAGHYNEGADGPEIFKMWAAPSGAQLTKAMNLSAAGKVWSCTDLAFLPGYCANPHLLFGAPMYLAPANGIQCSNPLSGHVRHAIAA